MPLKDIRCIDCNKVYPDQLVPSGADPECPNCGSKNAQYEFSYAGGYVIYGNNSSSVSPKRSGGGK